MLSINKVAYYAMILVFIATAEVGYVLIQIELASDWNWLWWLLPTGVHFSLCMLAFLGVAVASDELTKQKKSLTHLRALLTQIDHKSSLTVVRKAAIGLDRSFSQIQSLQSQEKLGEEERDQKHTLEKLIDAQKDLFWGMVEELKNTGQKLDSKLSYKDFMPGERFGKGLLEKD